MLTIIHASKNYLPAYLETNPSKRDSVGSYIQSLVRGPEPVYAVSVERRFDLGNLQSCVEADQYYQH